MANPLADCELVTNARKLGKTLRKRIIMAKISQRIGCLNKVVNPHYLAKIADIVDSNPRLVNLLMEKNQTRSDLVEKLSDYFSYA